MVAPQLEFANGSGTSKPSGSKFECKPEALQFLNCLQFGRCVVQQIPSREFHNRVSRRTELVQKCRSCDLPLSASESSRSEVDWSFVAPFRKEDGQGSDFGV